MSNLHPSSSLQLPSSPFKDNDCLLHHHLLRPTSFSRYFYLYCASFSFSYFVLFVFHAVDNYNSFGTSSPSMGTSDVSFFVIHQNMRGGAKGFQSPHIAVNLFNITRWKVPWGAQYASSRYGELIHHNTRSSRKHNMPPRVTGHRFTITRWQVPYGEQFALSRYNESIHHNAIERPIGGTICLLVL